MSTPSLINHTSQEHIYDKYSAQLYGIALKISTSSKEAEDILVGTFTTFFQQDRATQNTGNILLQLLRISMRIAAENSYSSKKTMGQLLVSELNKAK